MTNLSDSGVSPIVAGKPLKIVVLVSGQGTLCQAIIAGQGQYQVVGVVADCSCPAITNAAAAQITAEVVQFPQFTAEDSPEVRALARQAWNEDLATAVGKYQPDLVVSAGFMRILSPIFLQQFDRILNTHPALLPSFPGAHAVRDALAAGVRVTGCTVHEVDEGVDSGKIVAQEPVRVLTDDTEASLHERIKQVERQLIVQVLNAEAFAAN